MKLKIVFVVTAPYVIKYHLPNFLRRITTDFDICVVGQNVSEFKEIYPSIKWIDINIERKIQLLSDLRALFALMRVFYLYKPDITHSFMSKAGLLSSIAGILSSVPIRIHTFTGQVWATKSGLSKTFLKATDRIINSLNTVCLTDSHSQSKFLSENNFSYMNSPLPVLLKGSLSGVDILRFSQLAVAERVSQLRVTLNLSEDLFIFTYIARKTCDKGAVDMLKAFQSVSILHNHVFLLFIGPDEDGEVSRLRSTSPELFQNVIDIGAVIDPEIYLAITDVLCLPSYREGFGSIVIDAAAMGVPAIGSRIPGLVDAIVDNETGLLFPVGDLTEFVKHMCSFIKNPQQLQLMGTCAKERVDEFFTADLLYTALKNFYLEVVESNHNICHKLR